MKFDKDKNPKLICLVKQICLMSKWRWNSSCSTQGNYLFEVQKLYIVVQAAQI